MQIALEEIGPVMGAAAVFGVTVEITVKITVEKVSCLYEGLHGNFQNAQYCNS
jgi:hypothetical protein